MLNGLTPSYLLKKEKKENWDVITGEQVHLMKPIALKNTPTVAASYLLQLDRGSIQRQNSKQRWRSKGFVYCDQ